MKNKSTYSEATNKGNPTRITSSFRSLRKALNSLDNKLKMYMQPSILNELVTDEASFRDNLYKTLLETESSYVLDSVNQMERAISILKLKYPEDAKHLEELDFERYQQKTTLDANECILLGNELDQAEKSIRKAFSKQTLQELNALELLQKISANKESVKDLHKAYFVLEKNLEGQSFNGNFGQVFIKVFTDIQEHLIRDSINTSQKILSQIEEPVVDLFKGQSIDFKTRIEMVKSQIDKSAQDKSRPYFENALNKGWEEFQIFLEKIYEKKSYPESIKTLLDSLKKNQEKFFNLQKSFKVYKKLYKFRSNSESIKVEFDNNLLAKARDSVLDSLHEINTCIEVLGKVKLSIVSEESQALEKQLNEVKEAKEAVNKSLIQITRQIRQVLIPMLEGREQIAQVRSQLEQLTEQAREEDRQRVQSLCEQLQRLIEENLPLEEQTGQLLEQSHRIIEELDRLEAQIAEITRQRRQLSGRKNSLNEQLKQKGEQNAQLRAQLELMELNDNNLSASSFIEKLKEIQATLEKEQSFFIKSSQDLNDRKELQELLNPLNEQVQSSSKMIKSYEVLEKYSDNIPLDLLLPDGKFYENFLRFFYKKQMDLGLDKLDKAKKIVKQLVELKGFSKELKTLESSIRECKSKLIEEGKKGRVFEYFDTFQKQIDKIKVDLISEIYPHSIGPNPILTEIDALRDLHESIKGVLEQIPDHEITEDTFTGIDWLEKFPFEGY